MAASRDIGIAEAVDDARAAIEQSHDAAHIATACDGAAARCDDVIAVVIFCYGAVRCQYTAVVDTARTGSLVADGTGVGAAADVDIVEDDILHRSAVDAVEQGMSKVADGEAGSVESAGECCRDSTRPADRNIRSQLVAGISGCPVVDIRYKVGKVCGTIYQVWVSGRSRPGDKFERSSPRFRKVGMSGHGRYCHWQLVSGEGDGRSCICHF